MLKLNNDNGMIIIEDSVIAGIVSIVAGNCFGISGMAAKNTTEEIWGLLKQDKYDRGISVKCVNNEITVDMHILVVFGINIPAITDSIIHKVTYTLEESTGFHVSGVNIYVDSVYSK